MRLSRFVPLPLAMSLLVGPAWPQRAADTPVAQPYLPLLVAAERSTATVPPAALSGPRSPEIDEAIRKNGSALQNLGTMRSFVGDTEGAIATFDLISSVDRPRQGATAQPAPDGVAAEEAIRAIVAQARSKRVVLINESHHVPMNRAFTMKLAAELRKIGYSYLACETFSARDGDMETFAPGRAITRTGYYVREPVFAGFVNAALADGWQLVAYEYAVLPQPGETPQQRMQAREEGQARNLVERIFAKDKNAKVLIHVGYGHLYRETPDMPLVVMGGYLHRMTGLDMLHVDQTPFHAHPDRTREAPMYAALLAKFPLQEPFVLRAADGSHPVLLGMAGRVDMQVIFPRYATLDGRPDWLRTLAGRSARPVPADLLPTQGRRLVKALRVGDPADAVPADIVLVDAGKPAPALMLPPGEFHYTVEDE